MRKTLMPRSKPPTGGRDVSADITAHHRVRMGSDRSFGMVFAGVFALIGLWPMLAGSGPVRVWSLAIAGLFAILALMAPKALAPLNRLWFRLGHLLGRIVAPIVMGLVFFVAVTPTALIARLFNKDFLLLDERLKNRTSFWIDREQSPEQSSSMKNQF